MTKRWLMLHGAALAALATALPVRAAAQSAIDWRIERQELGTALIAFSRQSGRQVLFAPELVRGKTVRPLRGRMEPTRALAALLRGSGLHYREASGGTLLIEPARATQAPADPAPAPAGAQTPAPNPTETPATDATAEPPVQEDIVVVGTAGGGTRRQNAAFAVTSIDSTTAQRLGAQSTAEVLRVVPGVSTESSGGKNGANIFVRGYPSGGDAEYVTLQYEGVPFFPPPTLSFLENTQLIRTDETLGRVEAVRGGTGALFSNGQPGLTVNFVQREGGQRREGLVKLQGTDFGEFRADAVASGPIDSNTTFLVGGFYNVANGIRDPRFEAERGGQISGNIRHDFAKGSVLVFGRYLDDRGQWLLPIPVIQNGDQISAYPGFSAGSGTLLGPDNRFGTRNDGSRIDLGNGRGAQIGNVGFNAEYALADGLQFRDRFSYLVGRADTFGLVPGGTAPQSAAAFAAGLGGTIRSLNFVTGGAAADPNTQIVQAGQWSVTKRIESYVNDAALEWKYGRNKLTGGIFYTSYSSRDRWNLGNSLLLTAEPNARRLNLVLNDGRIVTRDGYTGGAFFNVNADYTGEDIAGYVVDEWQITDKLRIDAGVRYQSHSVDGRLENNGTTGAAGRDGNPLTLFDNNDAVLNGTFSTIRYRGDAWSWTAGVNYDFTRQIGAFFRYSRGNSFPFFDNLRDGITVAPRVDSYEGGVKVSAGKVSAYITAFHNDFNGLATTVITNGAPIASIGGAGATGVEFEGAVRPVRGLLVTGSATYLDATYSNFFTDGGRTNLSGNTVQRQPRWQWRVTPSYDYDFGNRTKAGAFLTVGYIGRRFSDVQNQQVLPSYYKVDAGITIDVGPVQFAVLGDNLTDTIGLTEGNPRVIGTQGGGAIFARPIVGRSVRFAGTVRF